MTAPLMPLQGVNAEKKQKALKRKAQDSEASLRRQFKWNTFCRVGQTTSWISGPRNMAVVHRKMCI
jgi:hypothetical protein